MKIRMKPGFVRLALVVLLAGCAFGQRGDLRVPLPRKSPETPVQQLNREGVKELKRGHVNKAKERFVKAYLLDPDDPFTLNNLGYIAELEGDADRALKYYQLAATTPTDAVIDEASIAGLKGQPVSAALQSSEVSAYQRNRANFQAMALLEKGRTFEAEMILKRAIQSDPKNPFLLDSLGYVMESEGDLQGALQYYTEAADLHSDERVVLTPRRRWRGRPISEIAANNAALVREALSKGEDTDSQVARLNLRGVAALNHNDTTDAQKYFSDAYRLDPSNAFTLNNIGYIAELVGDRETAEMYYDAARTALESNEKVTYATRPDAEGRRMMSVAGTNEDDVDATLKAIQARKRTDRHPIRLMLRDGSVAPVATRPTPQEQQPREVPTPPLPPPRLPERDTTPHQQPSPGVQPLPSDQSPPPPPTDQ
jgi:Flp pilus assembly protein TadD